MLKTWFSGSRPFWLLAAASAVVLGASSVPSPLYTVFQKQWHFSPLIITIIFAVYAVALLVTLLIGGSLPDYIGYRSVLVGALLLEALSMVAMALAGSVGMLIAARIVQGIATGASNASVSAGLIDKQPADKPHLAPLINTIIPLAGLGVGALAAGIFVQYGPWPTHLIFWVLFVLCILLAALVVILPGILPRKPGWQHALKPSVEVAPAARRTFLVILPSLVASWTLAGFYSSLGPSITTELLHNSNHIVGSMVLLLLFGVGAIASFALRNHPPTYMVTFGVIATSLGLLVTTLGIISAAPIIFFGGTTIAGIGFGPAFTGGFRSIMDLASVKGRAALASAIYIVAYLALSVPTVIAGVAVMYVGLHNTALIYALASAVLYCVTLVMLRMPKTNTQL